MSSELISISHAELLTLLTPEAEAKIIGGVKISPPNETGKSSTNITIEKTKAKIRIELGKVSPNQTFSNKFGKCTSYHDELTGQLNFACTLKDTYPI